MRARPIKLDGVDLYVEVLDADFAGASGTGFRPEQVTPIDKLEETKDSIIRTLRSMTTTVHEALHESSPSEFSVEVNLAFGGDIKPIPFLVSADAKASIKIKAVWKAPVPTPAEEPAPQD